MIQTIVKEYIDGEFACYKLTYTDGTFFAVPHNEANRHYQEILEWVAEGNTITDNGGGE